MYETARGNSAHSHSIPRKLSNCLQVKTPQGTPYKFGFDFSMPAKIVCSNYRQALSFAMKRLLYAKGSDTTAKLTSVTLWSASAKAATKCNPNLVPANWNNAVTRLPQRPKESTCKWKSLAASGWATMRQCVAGIDKRSIPDCVPAQVFLGKSKITVNFVVTNVQVKLRGTLVWLDSRTSLLQEKLQAHRWLWNIRNCMNASPNPA